MEAAATELTQLRGQLSSINKKFEEERTAWKNDKKTLEDTIVDMTTSEKHLESDKSTREQEVRTVHDFLRFSGERSLRSGSSHDRGRREGGKDGRGAMD